jgi:hypothetical protein
LLNIHFFLLFGDLDKSFSLGYAHASMALRSLNHDFIVHEALVLVLRLLDALVAGHGARSDEGLVQSLVETGDDLFQVTSLLLDKQRRIFWGDTMYPPFCGITGVFNNYYGMAVSHKSQNHNTLTYHNDS